MPPSIRTSHRRRMSVSKLWQMASGKIVEGVFAINKPAGISSAQVVRDLQYHFDPSSLFAPWISAEKTGRARDSHNQRHRRRQKEIHVKIGHGGTLDPIATGVLIAGVGKGTKVLQTFLDCTKTYETVVLFGASTDSYDRVGNILKRASYAHITKEMVQGALAQFRGKFMQLPPLYSALKMNGKPLYEYAREGKEIPREIERRQVDVHELELVEWMEGGTHQYKLPENEAGTMEKEVAEKLWKQERTETALEGDGLEGNVDMRKRKLEEAQDELVQDRPTSKRKTSISESEAIMSGALQSAEDVPGDAKDVGPPAAKLRMTVTSGFYVRSLCHDLGEAVGSQAIMSELVRTRQGQFELGKNVLEYEELKKGEDSWGPQVEAMLDEWSAEYRPFAGSTAESNVAPPARSEEHAQAATA